MNTQTDNQNFVHSDWFDPFPEPRTIPSGWDTRAFLSAPQADSAADSDSSTEAETH